MNTLEVEIVSNVAFVEEPTKIDTNIDDIFNEIVVDLCLQLKPLKLMLNSIKNNRRC